MRYVEPKTYLIGGTEMYMDNLMRYLTDTEQQEFLDLVNDNTDAEMLTSFYAKLCYAALTTHKNDNISRVRAVTENIKGTMKSAHMSVFEHVQLNFVTTDCSRVFTHELARHRVGIAFSQTSGRYVRATPMRFITDPILDPVKDIVDKAIDKIEDYYKKIVAEMITDDMPMAQKKKITSAMRRILPNGQANEMGWSCNLRTLRHLLMMRTSRHAEWEIRMVFNQVFGIIQDQYPIFVSDARTIDTGDGLFEVVGMKMQPYEQDDARS